MSIYYFKLDLVYKTTKDRRDLNIIINSKNIVLFDFELIKKNNFHEPY